MKVHTCLNCKHYDVTEEERNPVIKEFCKKRSHYCDSDSSCNDYDPYYDELRIKVKSVIDKLDDMYKKEQDEERIGKFLECIETLGEVFEDL